jgi:hypothetical protein
MSTNSNEDAVILSDDLILLIFSFIENPFHNSIPLSFLFCSKKDYIKKKKLYNIYCNLFHSCKKFYPLKYKDSYIIFNKEYSKKYNESEEFKTEVSNKINSQYLLTYSEFPEYDDFEENLVNSLVNSCNEKIVLHNYSDFSIHILKDTYKEVLIFMKLENTQVKKVSKVHIILAINNYIKKEKANNNPDIFVEGDDRRFRLIGDLKILFDFIKKQIIKRDKLEDLEIFNEDIIRYFNEDIIRYIDLNKYIKYCVRQKIFNLI